LAVTVKPPAADQAITPDPLLAAARALAADYLQLPQSPICLSLAQAGVVGLAGPRSAVLTAMRGLVLQLATHHSPDEVKLVALYPAAEADEWAWLRWLPHVWSDDRRQRWR
jgi:S-DNA-T family DNA segregation ATPase FtsK/SpoIIIE